MYEEIVIGNEANERVRICVCQIEMPDDQIASYGRTLSAAALESARMRLARFIDESIAHAPHAIQFPEVTVPQELIPFLVEQATKHRIIIIGGSHYSEQPDGFVSRCPIIFPDGSVHITEKLTPSPHEKPRKGGKKVIPGVQRLIFRNTSIGDFCVLICSDYLTLEIMAEIEEWELDFLFVSSFHKGASQYHGKLAEQCLSSRNGIYCCFSNVQHKRHGDGGSAVFGVTHTKFLPAFSEAGYTNANPIQKVWEAKSGHDFAVVEFDIFTKKPSVPTDVLQDPNIDIVATRSDRKFERTKDARPRHKLIAFDMDGTIVRGLEFSWTKLWELCGDNGALWGGIYEAIPPRRDNL